MEGAGEGAAEGLLLRGGPAVAVGGEVVVDDDGGGAEVTGGGDAMGARLIAAVRTPFGGRGSCVDDDGPLVLMRGGMELAPM